MRLLLSSYSLEPFPLEEVFLLARELKSDGLELVLTPAVYQLGLARIKELSQKYQLPILNLHQPPWGIFFTGRAGVRRLIKKAQFLGAENIVIHLATMRRGARSPFFDWIKQEEKRTGINIAFENGASRFLEGWPQYAADPAKLEKFIKARQVNITLDVAKLVLAGEDPYQFFQRNHDRVKVMHFHGLNGRGYHLGFKGHNFDWSGFMSFTKKYNYAGTVTLEIFPLDKLIYFGLPPASKLAEAKDVIAENFEVLKRV